MFRVSNNNEKAITKKKKLMFISTLSSNETSSFNEPKQFEDEKKESQTTSKSSSMSNPLPSQKNKKKYFGNHNKNIVHHKILPMKRILFRLYHANIVNQKKERSKTKSQNKKDNNNIIQKKNGIYNLKHKHKNLATKKNNIPQINKNYSAGRWKSDEHQRFIDAIIKYGNNWRQVQKYVGTRSSTQTRSHAQKFFEKLKRSKIFKKEKYDFSKNSLKILHDIMKSLPDNEYNQILKLLNSLSHERKSNLNKDKKIITNNNEIINFNENINENKENNMEIINYDGNNNNNHIINEDNLKCIKYCNQGYCFLDSNNNKLYNNDDYLFNNNYNNCNINFNSNNFLNNDYLNYDIGSCGRKESDIFSQRINSLSEFNLNFKELKEQNNDDLNMDYNYNIDYNNFNLNTQQENKINTNKIFDINEDKIGYTKQFNNAEFLFNQTTSRKMSLEEKIFN